MLIVVMVFLQCLVVKVNNNVEFDTLRDIMHAVQLWPDCSLPYLLVIEMAGVWNRYRINVMLS